MTQAKRWPNNMMNYRDNAAQATQDALRLTRRLLNDVKSGEFTRQGLEIALLTIENKQLRAIRNLEKADARTEPD